MAVRREMIEEMTEERDLMNSSIFRNNLVKDINNLDIKLRMIRLLRRS